MTLLVAGLVLFFAVHAVPGIAPLRAALVAGMGERPYRGVFSLIVLASIALVVWGFSEAPFEPVYAPAPWGRHAATIAVPAALVLFVAANMPTHIRAVLRHPMLLGLLVWALAHLAANDDLASVVLFGGFAAFAVLAALSAGGAREKSADRQGAPAGDGRGRGGRRPDRGGPGDALSRRALRHAGLNLPPEPPMARPGRSRRPRIRFDSLRGRQQLRRLHLAAGRA